VTILRDQEGAECLGARLRDKAAKEYSWLGVGERLNAIYDSVAPGLQSNWSPEGASA